MKKKAIIIHEQDNVATALLDLQRGDCCMLQRGDKSVRLCLAQDIPFGHKFALADIPQGREVIKYGEIIGTASKPINVGEHVHVHNVESLHGRGDLRPKK